jgi:hypothetical protein
VRGGERQARAAFRLVGRDPTIKRVMLLEALGLIVLWVAFVLLRRGTGSMDREADRVFEEWLYWLAGSGIATFCSVAVAFAVDARIDGVAGDLRMVSGEVRRRLPAILCWWLISVGCELALGFAAHRVMSPFLELLVIAVVWGVATFFVVPAIALGSGGPLKPYREALRLLRARWGRALAGLFVIGFVFGIFFVVCGFVLVAIARASDSTSESLWRYGATLFLLDLAYALTAATRAGFAVILARDALDDLPGEPPAARPRRRAVVALRRIAIGVLVVAIGFVVLGLIVRHSRSTTQPAGPVTYVAPRPPVRAADARVADFATPLREPAARRLRPGAPVVLAGKTIGRVNMVNVKRGPLVEVFFDYDRRHEGAVIRGQKVAGIRGGDAYLVIVPRGSGKARRGG